MTSRWPTISVVSQHTVLVSVVLMLAEKWHLQKVEDSSPPNCNPYNCRVVCRGLVLSFFCFPTLCGAQFTPEFNEYKCPFLAVNSKADETILSTPILMPLHIRSVVLAVCPLWADAGEMLGCLHARGDARGGGLVVLLELPSTSERGHEDRPVENAWRAGERPTNYLSIWF